LKSTILEWLNLWNLQWHDLPTEFHKDLPTGSEVDIGTGAQTEGQSHKHTYYITTDFFFPEGEVGLVPKR
jgi:hypothetical protein